MHSSEFKSKRRSSILGVALFVALFAVMLTGCLPGNGEPYGFTSTPGDAPSPGNSAPGPVGTSSPSSTDEPIRSYYWEDPSFKCQLAETGELISSYRQELQLLRNGKWLLRGSLCDANSAEVLLEGDAVQLYSDKLVVGYEGGIYRAYASGTPDGRYIKEYCRFESADQYMDFAIYQHLDTGIDSASLFSFDQVKKVFNRYEEPVDQTLSEIETRYVGSQVMVVIANNIASPNQWEYTASVSATLEGIRTEFTMLCRRPLTPTAE